jgi:multidrug resistance efflux pump
VGVVVALVVGVLLLGAVGWVLFPFGRAPKELVLSGVVEVQDVRLGAKVNGRVAEVLVPEGVDVKGGTPLVRLALPELQAQLDQMQAQLESARADKKRTDDGARPLEIDQARAAYEGAQSKLDRTKQGWRDEEKRQAKHDLDATTADLIQANRDLTRNESLIGTGGITQADLDQARATRDRAAARNSSAKVKYEMMSKGGWQADIDEATAERNRLKAQYELLKEGNRQEDKDIAAAKVKQLEAQVRELKAQVAEGVIRAEEPCYIEVMSVRKGDLVTANQPVVRVLRAEDLWVRVYVPETELAKVRRGQPARITLDGYPGITFAGQVSQIATIGEFTPRNIQSADQRKHQVFAIKVRVDDPRGIFKSGLAAEVVLPLYGADQ